MTSRDEIREWLKSGIAQGATHVLVACDTFDYSDYPIFVMPDESAKAESDSIIAGGDRIMECYNLSMDIDEQLAAHRVFNY